MNQENARQEFWMCLIDIIDSIGSEQITTEKLACMLTGIEEGYRDIFDPVTSYEEYVAFKLCGSIRSVIEASASSNNFVTLY